MWSNNSKREKGDIIFPTRTLVFKNSYMYNTFAIYSELSAINSYNSQKTIGR